MGRRRNTDGGTLFDSATAPVKVSLLGKYDAMECVDLLQQVRNTEDVDALRNVLSVAILRLSDARARQACDLLIQWIGDAIG